MANKATPDLPLWLQPDDDDEEAARIVREMTTEGGNGDGDGAAARPGDNKLGSLTASALASSKPAKKKGKSKKKTPDKTPQQKLNEYWQFSTAPRASKVTSVFPRRLYKQLVPESDVFGLDGNNNDGDDSASRRGSGTSSSWSTLAAAAETDGSSTPPSPSPVLGASTANAAASYEAAASRCRAAVARVVRECRRTNEKFTDQEFSLENDRQDNCLRGLVRRCTVDGGDDGNAGLMPFHTPRSVHRVDWVFSKPVFTVAGGFAASDIRQGRLGNCWWIASVATIAHRTDLMARICVARDEACGVYGFVFQRDGAWAWVVVDDTLYLQREDFVAEKYDSTGQRAHEHRERYQQGSKALSFAHCDDDNETWLPLLEKAFAKAHGDYGALAGGWTGEGVEDLTGGVSTTVTASRVLDKERLWQELLNAGSSDSGNGNDGGDFVFGLSIMGGCSCPLANHNGLAVNHCYSVLRAVEAESEDGATKERLVQIRNPWGERNEWTGFGEWHGPWSDGSKEWTPYWLAKLGHTFGDNGVFWMSYADVLATFGWLHRTRLFDAHWTVVQRWATVDVSWLGMGYLPARFLIHVKKPGTVVVVLSQLDDRYFRGLRGQYRHQLHFVLRALTDDGSPGDVLSVVHASNVNESRSVSCEVDLDHAGCFEVLPQVKAERSRRKVTVDEVVRESVETNPDKLRQIGRQYDEAHAKGADVADEDGALEAKRARKLARIRAKLAWAKAQKQRAKERRFRDEQVEWKMRREAEKMERREKRREEKRAKAKEKAREKKAAAAAEKGKEKATEEETAEKKTDDDKKKASENEKANAAVAATSSSETAAATADKDKDKDDVSDISSDDSDSDSVEIDFAPEPRPEPEPDFGDTDSDDDDDDDDLLLLREESDSDDDDDGDSDSELAKIKKRIERRMWPYDSDSDAGDGHYHHHGRPKKTTFREDKWNAVCVVGLRVYSQDPETSIELRKAEGGKSTAPRGAVEREGADKA